MEWACRDYDKCVHADGHVGRLSIAGFREMMPLHISRTTPNSWLFWNLHMVLDESTFECTTSVHYMLRYRLAKWNPLEWVRRLRSPVSHSPEIFQTQPAELAGRKSNWARHFDDFGAWRLVSLRGSNLAEKKRMWIVLTLLRRTTDAYNHIDMNDPANLCKRWNKA